MATDRVMILRIGLQLLWLPKKRGERERVRCRIYRILSNMIPEKFLFENEKLVFED